MATMASRLAKRAEALQLKCFTGGAPEQESLFLGSDLALHLPEQRIASAPVLLWCHVGHVAKPLPAFRSMVAIAGLRSSAGGGAACLSAPVTFASSGNALRRLRSGMERISGTPVATGFFFPGGRL
jgi:hypothetical protein